MISKQIFNTSVVAGILTCFLFTTQINCQTRPSQPNPVAEFSYKSAHPKAQALMKEDFFWSPIEETGPFGSDDGSDAAFGFLDWRFQHKSVSPVKYLNELIRDWKYPFFDYTEMDTAKIKKYILSQGNLDEATIQERIKMLKDAAKNSTDSALRNSTDKHFRDAVISASQEMGGSFLVGQDNAIIGTGFAQFVLEGKIDSDLKKITIIALNRQLLPMLINRYDEKYRQKRKEQLEKMLEVINKIY